MFLRIKKEKKTKGMRLLGRNGEGRIGGGGGGDGGGSILATTLHSGQGRQRQWQARPKSTYFCFKLNYCANYYQLKFF